MAKKSQAQRQYEQQLRATAKSARQTNAAKAKELRNIAKVQRAQKAAAKKASKRRQGSPLPGKIHATSGRSAKKRDWHGRFAKK